jgi:hypothetical protein
LRMTPVVPSSLLYEPRPGSIRLFFEMPIRFKPVTLFRPNLAPGSITSVGWSKLCHNSTSEEVFSTMARFPVFKRTALVVFMLVLVILAMLVDQITDSLLSRFTMTRFPSLEIFSCVWLMLGPMIGVSLLATHTVVKTGILLNHMPRYQLGEVVVLVDLLEAPDAVGWKKPSANLLFLETSLSPTVSTWLAVRTFVVAAEQVGVCCREEKKRSPSSMWRAGMENSGRKHC